MSAKDDFEKMLNSQIATMNYLKRKNGELKKEVKGLKEHNHKLKHQYDLLQIRHCALNDKHQRLNNIIKALKKEMEKCNRIEIDDYVSIIAHEKEMLKILNEVGVDKNV